MKYVAGADLKVFPLVDLISRNDQWNLPPMTPLVDDYYQRYQTDEDFVFLTFVCVNKDSSAGSFVYNKS